MSTEQMRYGILHEFRIGNNVEEAADEFIGLIHKCKNSSRWFKRFRKDNFSLIEASRTDPHKIYDKLLLPKCDRNTTEKYELNQELLQQRNYKVNEWKGFY